MSGWRHGSPRSDGGGTLLFGLGTPLAKLLLAEVNPWLLAGCCIWDRALV